MPMILLVNMHELLFWKTKKELLFFNAFQSILNSSKRKPNKKWVDKCSEFYNSPFKEWLKTNDIKMYSTYNEEKSVVNERFIRTFKKKIFKHMIPVTKNVSFDVLDDIVNNTWHITHTIELSKWHLIMLNLIVMLNIMWVLMRKIIDFK